MKALSSSFDKNATAQDKARAKMQVLEKQISTQQKYIDTLNQKYDAQKQKLETKNETIYPQGINDGGCHYVALECNSAE